MVRHSPFNFSTRGITPAMGVPFLSRFVHATTPITLIAAGLLGRSALEASHAIGPVPRHRQVAPRDGRDFWDGPPQRRLWFHWVVQVAREVDHARRVDRFEEPRYRRP